MYSQANRIGNAGAAGAGESKHSYDNRVGGKTKGHSIGDRVHEE